MKQKLIRATELAEFVYCSKAWHLKYLDGAEVSPMARELQAEASAWHIDRVNRSLVVTATDGQVSPRSCWRLFSLCSVGWSGRNDGDSDGLDSDCAGSPVLLVERPVP
jgi:hypothetical protein